MNITQSSRFIEASKLNSTAPLIANGPPRLYALITSGEFINQNRLLEQFYKLVKVAECAYGARNLEALKSAGRELLILPIKEAADAGMYFLAIVAKRQGRIKEARALLEQVAESSTSKFRARAIQALAAIEFEAGRFEEAARFHSETIKAARRSDDLSLANALFQVSALKSMAGDHRQALHEIEKLWPLVRITALEHAHLFYMYHNELAYELAQVGKLTVAQQVIQVAINSPLADKYAEWQETDADIQQQITRPLIIAVPAIEKPTQPSKTVRSIFIFANQLGRRVLNQWPTIKDNQITCQVISEWVKLCTPIRAPTAIS
jgi:tetratricopeptide (TPR) repeat protein